MWKNLFFVLICFTSAANLACSTTDTATSTNANVGNVVNLDPANLPPGFSTSPVPVNGNIPGITNTNDANANKIPGGNIPGIPDPNKKTPQPKNTPPIPGIPSEAEIKKQMNTPLQDVNVVNNPPKSQTDANSRPADKRANTRQP
jgi:hypothetical protein